MAMRLRLPHLLRPKHPAQQVANAFVLAIVLTTVLLMLPLAHEPGVVTPLHTALFTATSALCVVGLNTVDTPLHWSTFGEVVIMVAMQVGSIGIMTAASLLGLVVSRRLGLRTRLTAAAETQSLSIGDVRRLLRDVAITLAVIEAALAVILVFRFHHAYDQTWAYAAFSGLFHAVSATSNGGFSLNSNSFVPYASDYWICVPVGVAIVASSLGFPALFEVIRKPRTPGRWSLHTKITVFGTGVLVIGGTMMFVAFEWSNTGTIGAFNVPQKLLAGFFQGVSPRSAGLNSIDFGQAQSTTLLGTDVLMFIGGGSGGTAGGIKVTTFMVLFFAILSEARGDSSVELFNRRLPQSALRLAISVALLGMAVVTFGTLSMLAITGADLDRVLFEVVSAFGTAGLSTGLTTQLDPAAQYVLIAVMFVGRIGTITLASALALRTRQRLYRLPEEQPIIG